MPVFSKRQGKKKTFKNKHSKEYIFLTEHLIIIQQNTKYRLDIITR